MKKIFSKAMWVGRTAVFAVGLAVILALVLGVASAALAAKAPALKLGVQNAVRAATSMVGSVAGPVLRLDNNGAGTALDLQVEPGSAPLTVSPEAGTATGLSADELDGKSSEELLAADGKAANSDLLDGKDSGAFFGGSTYIVASAPTDNSTGALTNVAVRCDVGDVALGGGYSFLEPNEGTVRADEPLDVTTVDGVQQAWNVQWVNASPSLDSNVVVEVRCADFAPAHSS